MTLNLLVTIIAWVFSILFAIGLCGFWFLFGKSRVKDNPAKAYIFIKTGRHISKPIKGNRVGKPTLKGSRFKYGENIVFVPATYSDDYIACRRAIFISRIGQLIASPFDEDVALSSDEKDQLIYEICESHVGSDAMKFLKGKSIVNVAVVAVIAFVIGALVVYGFIQFQEVMERQKAANSSPPAQQQLKPPLEVK